MRRVRTRPKPSRPRPSWNKLSVTRKLKDFPIKNLHASMTELEAIERGQAPEVYVHVYKTTKVTTKARKQARQKKTYYLEYPRDKPIAVLKRSVPRPSENVGFAEGPFRTKSEAKIRATMMNHKLVDRGKKKKRRSTRS